MEAEIIIAEENKRIDAYLASISAYSRNRIQNLLKSGSITVNGKQVRASYVLSPGDQIEIEIPEPEIMNAKPEPIPLNIVYEDDDICVINKPQGMVVHPANGHPSGTLVNGLMYHFGSLSTIGGELRPGIVHRIDRMTSGLLVVAKNDFSHIHLSEQFKTHTANREYLTIVCGNLKDDTGTIDAPIGRHPIDRKKMSVVQNGRNAVTHWEVIERLNGYTLLKVRLETGRTHQIRVHMAYVHHPVAGDDVYGSEKKGLHLEGQALHGYKLRIEHPKTGERMVFYAPVPDYFAAALKSAGWRGNAEDLIENEK